MRLNLSLKLTAVCLLLSLVASAQYNKRGKGLSRFEIGYNYVMTSADYQGNFLSTKADFTDTTITRTGNVKTSFAYGVTMGTYFPVKRGRNGCLAIDLDFNYNFMLWKGIGDGLYGTTVGWDFSGVTIQAGLPVGLEYKFGCDGTYDRSKRMCFSLGAGVYPSYSLTSFEDGAGVQFNASPYAKAELGIFAGICMKLRVTAAMTNVDYISQTNGFGGMYDKYLSNFTLKGKPTIMCGLIFMPFSWMWGHDGWWNTAEKSNRMYKGWNNKNKSMRL
ncbi:MAG: hypothetical protein JST82_02265 [Bacteroidetes bacterium]|nr:hypothetical protein [Bacteroidota bacterium]